jgi:hypothetical protein
MFKYKIYFKNKIIILLVADSFTVSTNDESYILFIKDHHVIAKINILDISVIYRTKNI